MTEKLKQSGAMSNQSTKTSKGLAAGLGTAIAWLIPIEGDAKIVIAGALTAALDWLLPNKPPWKK